MNTLIGKEKLFELKNNRGLEALILSYQIGGKI